MLNRENELALVAAATGGDQKAMMRLIEAHEPMFAKIVRQWRPRDPEDLHAHLVMSFIEHVPRFQADKNFRVNTYLRWYLREAARQFTNSTVNIARMPGKLSQRYGGFIRREMMRVEKAGEVFNSTHKREISKKLGISADDVELIIAHSQPSVSMDSLMPDNDVFIEEQLQDDVILDKQERRILAEALAGLEPRERRIIEARHATHDDPLTLEDLSIEYGVSRERIRQIETKALRKIKWHVAKLKSAKDHNMALAA